MVYFLESMLLYLSLFRSYVSCLHIFDEFTKPQMDKLKQYVHVRVIKL